MWCIHSTEYCSVLRRSEILIRGTMWMKLEDIVLGEISHTQKDILQAYLYEISRTSRLIETESRIEVIRGWGKGNLGVIV